MSRRFLSMRAFQCFTLVVCCACGHRWLYLGAIIDMHKQTSKLFPADTEEGTSALTPVKDIASTDSATPPVPPPDSGNTKPTKHHTHKGKPGKSIWKTAFIALLAFFIGLSFSACRSSDPKDSQDYKNLQSDYSKSQADLRKTRRELLDAQNQIKKVQDKADKWDKEQADKKAAEQKAEQDKKDQEKAAADKAAQEKAAADQALRIQAQQQQSQTQKHVQQQQVQPQLRSQSTVHRGAFCSGAGSTGASDQNGATLTCRTAKDGRLRWMN